MWQKTLQICMCSMYGAVAVAVAMAFYGIINMYVLNGLKSKWRIKFWGG